MKDKRELSEQEIAYICECLKSWEKIPSQYKELIFSEENKKQEYELKYWCKDREQDILNDTWSTPLQKIKTFNFDDEDTELDNIVDHEKTNTRKKYYKSLDKWHNKLIFWDNLWVLKQLLSDDVLQKQIKEKWGIKLIYIDPPFATKQDFKSWDGEKAYSDKIAWAEFIEFLRKRLIFLKELLAEDWSIYIHLDQKKGHYIKIILDEIFSETKFQSELIWNYSWWLRTEKKWNNKHDVIYMYSKTKNFIFNANNVLEDRRISEATKNRLKYKWALIKDWNKGRWDSELALPSDVFYVATINAMSKERQSYPTQKPEELMEKILKASSNEWDIVLDAFAGSWTIIAVAEKLWRKWIWIDCWKLAIYTNIKRLMNLKNKIWNKWETLNPKPFAVYNAWLYDFKIVKSLDWKTYVWFVLVLFQSKIKKHKINWIELDWFIWNSHVKVFNYNHWIKKDLDYWYIDNIHDLIWEKVWDKFYIIAPASHVNFLEDVVKKWNTEYYILRIPYSIINELHKKDFDKVKQPKSEQDVNDTVDAVGFDFIQIPNTKCEYFIENDIAIIKINEFYSRVISKKPLELDNLESLSMVFIDYNYNHEYLKLEEVYYADKLKKNDYKIELNTWKLDSDCMIVYIDIFWNEKREIINLSTFNNQNEWNIY